MKKSFTETRDFKVSTDFSMKTRLPDTKQFYSNLNLGHVKDAKCKHEKSVWKDFNLQNLGDMYDLYVQSDTLLLTDMFENISPKYFEIYKLGPAQFYENQD